ncbi:cytochrome c oxidase assembly protein [Aureimonas glaciei]|uniref:cytochrome c oxidase assembly protein n=1 Tax=Aureimonas glaciei TaxID=1776957 RepID=UPI00166E4416|nr:cytochrome c oxidase assembly protein [Aureimonas glaciei]
MTVAPLLSPSASPLRLWPLFLGLGLLAALWLGPLPERARGSFAAHMVMHMGIVAVAAPLLVLGLSRLWPALFRGIPPQWALAASFAEFAVVWGWHAPALHDSARVSTPLLLAEQASFLLAGLFVWMTALGTASNGGALAARAAGVAALLVTSMHMTLLGALLLFSPRPLYACADLCAPAASMTPVEDQALGGAIMLAVGGISYLAGGLILLASVLRGPSGREPEAAFADRGTPKPGMAA